MDASQKVRLNGLKTSGPYFAVWIQRSESGLDPLPWFCRAMTGLRANMAFVTTAGTGDTEPSLCCIDPVDRPKVAALVERDPVLSTKVQFGQTALGLFSIYPHQASLKTLGIVLEALNGHGIVLHGLASSIAALTFVLDFERLQEAVTILGEAMMLPVDPAAVQTQIMVRQIPPGS